MSDINMFETMDANKRCLANSSMGIRFPIWSCACSHQDFKYRLTSPGSRAKTTDYIMLASLSLSDSAEILRHPNLKYLTDHIVKYLRNFVVSPEDAVTMVRFVYCLCVGCVLFVHSQNGVCYLCTGCVLPCTANIICVLCMFCWSTAVCCWVSFVMTIAFCAESASKTRAESSRTIRLGKGDNVFVSKHSGSCQKLPLLGNDSSSC